MVITMLKKQKKNTPILLNIPVNYCKLATYNNLLVRQKLGGSFLKMYEINDLLFMSCLLENSRLILNHVGIIFNKF